MVNTIPFARFRKARPSGLKRGRRRNRQSTALIVAALVFAGFLAAGVANAAQLRAGVAKADITDREAGPVNDPLYVKALVLKDDTTTLVIITVDAVAIGEIGYISNDYLPTVRSRIKQELGIAPTNVMINASHCHGVVRPDVDELTFQAVKEALRNMVPVRAGAGTGYEDRIMENRRLKLKNGEERDVRRAYSLPPDEEVAEGGPGGPRNWPSSAGQERQADLGRRLQFRVPSDPGGSERRKYRGHRWVCFESSRRQLGRGYDGPVSAGQRRGHQSHLL